MRRLKPRRMINALPNEPRRHRQAVIRWVYIASVVGIAAFLGDLFLGSLFYLRSEGLVLGDQAVIAAEFPVTVRDIRVREGDHVNAGDVAAIVSSQSVAESVARLAADVASRETKLSELRVRRETAEAIIGFAETRHYIAANTRKELETILARGLLPLDKHTAAVETEYRSEQDLNSLKAERRIVDAELKSLSGVLGEADGAIAELRKLYDQGRMRVPMSGIVGRVAANNGSVVRTGDPLFEIYGERRYVLGYLPTGGLYEISPGDQVWIETGLRRTEGIVTRVEPIAAALPHEFQRAFTPVDRQQVLRIEFAAGEDPPPLFTKVKLRSKIDLSQWIASLWPMPGLFVDRLKQVLSWG
jgi:multidrug resistance efflux pump